MSSDSDHEGSHSGSLRKKAYHTLAGLTARQAEALGLGDHDSDASLTSSIRAQPSLLGTHSGRHFKGKGPAGNGLMQISSANSPMDVDAAERIRQQLAKRSQEEKERKRLEKATQKEKDRLETLEYKERMKQLQMKSDAELERMREERRRQRSRAAQRKAVEEEELKRRQAEQEKLQQEERAALRRHRQQERRRMKEEEKQKVAQAKEAQQMLGEGLHKDTVSRTSGSHINITTNGKANEDDMAEESSSGEGNDETAQQRALKGVLTQSQLLDQFSIQLTRAFVFSYLPSSGSEQPEVLE